MNTDHDLIYGAYKICEDDNETLYIKSLNFAVITTALTWNRLEAIFMLKIETRYMVWPLATGHWPDPEDQIQYFNAIIMWLLEFHALLRRYIISTDVNAWFIFDVERNIAYRVWKRQQTAADRTRYKKLRR
jgi:hypothetical protein